MNAPDPLEQRLSRQDLEAILSVTRALAAPFDLSTMLTEVTAAACRVLRAERCSVWLLESGGNELVARVASDIGAVHLPLGKGLIGVCARDRMIINVPDCYADQRFDPSMDRATGFRTRCSLTLPLIDHQGALIGAMQVLNKAGGVFDDGDAALAAALAAQCAIALARVRMTEALIEGERLKRELELARLVQLSSLPAVMPPVPGYDVNGLFLPAELTGGDTFDVARVEQGILVVLGDATGHGVAPALSVVQMHAMIRMAFRLGADLETAFRQVNDQLADTLPDGRFVTAFIGLLDPEAHRMRFLSGGQGPILHFRAALGSCHAYKATSFPMGAMRVENLRPAVTIDFAPGDVLVLLSDGVYEYADAGGAPFGRARVEQFLRDQRSQPTAVLAARLLDSVKAFAGGAPQQDDLTMVLVKRLGESHGGAFSEAK